MIVRLKTNATRAELIDLVSAQMRPDDARAFRLRADCLEFKEIRELAEHSFGVIVIPGGWRP